MKPNYQMAHVPADSLTVIDSKKSKKNVNILSFQEGIIKLSGFAIVQFLEGAELLNNDPDKAIDSYSTRKEINLILSLTKKAIIRHDPFVEIHVDYGDLKILRSWLEVRMAHCEKERDERTLIPGTDAPKFNPDTYIGQKLLLMDIRELMIGEVVPF